VTFEREGRSSYKSFFFIITLLYKVTEYIHADIKRNKYKTLYKYIHTSTRLYINMYIHIYVHIYTYIYTYIHIYTQTSSATSTRLLKARGA